VIRRDNLAIVVVGQAGEIRESLEKIGPVTVITGPGAAPSTTTPPPGTETPTGED